VKKSRKILFLTLLLILLAFVVLAPSLNAQSQPTATPFAPILIQGNPNVGRVQPFIMSDVAVRSGITAWQQNGWTGQGVRVGVLDRGFGGLFALESAFDTTVTTYVGADKSAYDANVVIHGTQVLETIHAVATGVELYACEYNNLDSFALCIDWMIASRVNIINHSAGVPALPLDGSSRWARQVERAANANILWVNAAGNFAQGYHPGIFTDRNVDRLHEFGGFAGEIQALGIASIETSSQGVVMLSWADHNGQPANSINLDLQVIDSDTGEVIAASYNEQSGFPGDEAIEYLAFPMNRPFAVQIIDFAGTAAGVRFALFVEFANLPNGEIQRSIITPGDSGSALTIGALQGLNIAPYSSRGPIETGAIKPDLAAPGEVRLADGSLFVGTSAAAPVVAGSAALIWQANPTYTARDVRTFILNATQDDDQFFGIDTNYGNGRLYLPLPVILPTLTPTATERPTDTPSPTVTETPDPTDTPSPTDTSIPIATLTEQATNLPTERPTSTPTPETASAAEILADRRATLDAQPTPTRRPTITPHPTATPTRRPTITPYPTAIPTSRPTATPRPTSAVVTDATIIYRDDFSALTLSNRWGGNPDVRRIGVSTLIIEGENDWWGVDYTSSITENEGILVLFQIDEPGDMNFVLENGAWGTPQNKRWSLYGGRTNSWEAASESGTGGSTYSVYDSETLRANVWYYLLFRVGEDGIFYTQLWEKDNPSTYLIDVIATPTGTNWETRIWTFFTQVYNGSMRWDSFEELRFPADYVSPTRPQAATGSIPTIQNEVIITAPGDYQSEIGCSVNLGVDGDWAPDCMRSRLFDEDGDGIYTFITNDIPAGDYEVKAAIGGSWEENYGLLGVAGGENIPFTVPRNNIRVEFSFDTRYHLLTITTGQQPTRTPQPIASDATVTINVSSANLRTGPGTNYNVAGTATSGQTFDVIARYEEWYLIDRGNQSDAWVWSGIVNLSGNQVSIEIAATIPPITTNSTNNSATTQTNTSSGNEQPGNLQLGDIRSGYTGCWSAGTPLRFNNLRGGQGYPVRDVANGTPIEWVAVEGSLTYTFAYSTGVGAEVYLQGTTTNYWWPWCEVRLLNERTGWVEAHYTWPTDD
jgi:SH3-like domain-containing protein